MKRTIEWFKSVKDEKLRKELLEAYDEDFEDFEGVSNNLGHAIMNGFSWARNGGRKKWDEIYDKSEEIELMNELEEEPKESKDYKYNVTIKGVELDVYNVLKAFEIKSPPIQHAIKKLLRSELEGHKSQVKDYEEAIKSIKRAKELLNE